jgi:hypothetical protein
MMEAAIGCPVTERNTTPRTKKPRLDRETGRGDLPGPRRRKFAPRLAVFFVP